MCYSSGETGSYASCRVNCVLNIYTYLISPKSLAEFWTDILLLHLYLYLIVTLNIFYLYITVPSLQPIKPPNLIIPDAVPKCM